MNIQQKYYEVDNMIKKNRIGDYGDFPPNWEKTKVLKSGTKIVVVTNGCGWYLDSSNMQVKEV